jgi:hypothetical protein
MTEELLKDLTDLATKYNIQIAGNIQTTEGTEAFVVGIPQGNVVVKEAELERLKKLLEDNKIAY